MKKTIAALVAALALAGAAAAQDVAAAEDAAGGGWRWGFLGSMEMGGHFVGGSGLDEVAAAGYGTLGSESVVALFSGGCFIRRPRVVDVALVASYLGGGSYTWADLFGQPDASFSLYADSLAVQIEVKPLFPFLGGVRPFVGAGYSITNGIVDEFGDGFVRGRGPFVVGGLDIVSLFGLALPLFSDDGKGYVGLRASVYYRPSYAYEFELDWDEFGVGYIGPPSLDELRTFFSRAFPAESLSFGIGLSIAYAPYRLGD